MDAIAAAPPGMSMERICRALGQFGIGALQTVADGRGCRLPHAPRRLTAAQGQAILDILDSERFVDASPSQVCTRCSLPDFIATLLL